MIVSLNRKLRKRFGKTIKRWKPTVVKPTPALLQDAWKWVLQLKCEGTHNVLGALRNALENEEERKHHIGVEGLYVFTSGMPDQNIDSLCSYLEENACGRILRCHTILFNVDDYDINGPIPGRWASIKKTAEALRTLAHSVPGGRFHWFRETGKKYFLRLKLLIKFIYLFVQNRNRNHRKR